VLRRPIETARLIGTWPRREVQSMRLPGDHLLRVGEQTILELYTTGQTLVLTIVTMVADQH